MSSLFGGASSSDDSSSPWRRFPSMLSRLTDRTNRRRTHSAATTSRAGHRLTASKSRDDLTIVGASAFLQSPENEEEAQSGAVVMRELRLPRGCGDGDQSNIGDPRNGGGGFGRSVSCFAMTSALRQFRLSNSTTLCLSPVAQLRVRERVSTSIDSNPPYTKQRTSFAIFKKCRVLVLTQILHILESLPAPSTINLFFMVSCLKRVKFSEV